MERLQLLAASDNPIEELDPDLGQLPAAVTINFSDCQVQGAERQREAVGEGEWIGGVD